MPCMRSFTLTLCQPAPAGSGLIHQNKTSTPPKQWTYYYKICKPFKLKNLWKMTFIFHHGIHRWGKMSWDAGLDVVGFHAFQPLGSPLGVLALGVAVQQGLYGERNTDPMMHSCGECQMSRMCHEDRSLKLVLWSWWWWPMMRKQERHR